MKKAIFITALCCLIMVGLTAAAGAAEGKKRIMVFGDSNTFGYFEDAQGVIGRLPLNTAWPGRMASLLGSDYEVVVEGLSGRTTRIDSPERSGTGIIPGAGMNGADYLPAALSSHMPLDMVVIMLGTGQTAFAAMLAGMGTGVSGMFETSMVAILVSAMCALIRAYGGFDALLYWIRRAFRGQRGGQLGMGLLVGAMDIATANNTVAIVMANPIAKEMSAQYGISSRKAASLLDTFSCIFQGVIPYGAQMLVALAAAEDLGHTLSAFQVMPYLLYPYFLLLSSLVFIFLVPQRGQK